MASKISLIKDDLIHQLEMQSKYDKYYLDLIDDYLFFYQLKNKLKKDIKDKGVRYSVTNGNGIEVEKPNESILNLTKVNTQMLKILSELNLKDSTSSPEGVNNDLC